jgi:ribonuclease P protein component
MIPRRERIPRAEFPKGQGHSVAFSFGTLRTYPSPSFRATVVISKKTLRSAVDRHRGKRKAYAALVVFKKLGGKASYIFYPNRSILSESVTTLTEIFRKRFS